MFLRASLQHLSRIIRDESRIPNINYDTFSDREEIAYQNLIQRLKKRYGNEYINELETYINEYTSDICEIYFNMGIKTGAKLITQLLDNEDKDF